MTEQHRDLSGQQRGHDVERVVAARGGDGEVQVGELRGEGLRRGEVGLGQAQDGLESTGVGRDQRAFDQAGARRRVGKRDDDQQLIGVGDHHAFGRVGVIGGAPQHRSPITAPHDAGQRVRPPGQVADDADVIADNDRGATQLAGPHRDDAAAGVAAQRTTPPAAVDGDHHGFDGVGVFGSGLGSRPRAPAGPDPDIGLVVLARAQSAAPGLIAGRPACRPTTAGTPAASWLWCRCPPPRRRARAARRWRPPSPSGGRHTTAIRRRATAGR